MPENVRIILIHGTFAKDAPWTRENSKLRSELRRKLVKQSVGVDFHVFNWSGWNSHKARIKAGRMFAKFLESFPQTNVPVPTFVIAHSHGGNVAFLSQNHVHQDNGVYGIATIGTPFIHVELNEKIKPLGELELIDSSKNNFWRNFFALFTSIFASFYFHLKSIEFFREQFAWISVFGYLISLVVSFVSMYFIFIVIRNNFDKFWYYISSKRTAVKLANAMTWPDFQNLATLSIGYRGDEAGFALKFLSLTSRIPNFFLKKFKLTTFTNVVVIPGIFACSVVIFFAIFLDTEGEIGKSNLEMLVGIASTIMLLPIYTWVLFSILRGVLTIFRGNPFGFGWERPGIHAHADITITSEPRFHSDRSGLHTQISRTAPLDVKGLRHSRLYNDDKVITDLSNWILNTLRSRNFLVRAELNFQTLIGHSNSQFRKLH